MEIQNEAQIEIKSLLPLISSLYGFDESCITPIPAHIGGRNITLRHIDEHKCIKIIRISFLHDRNYQDYLAELEFVHYLAENGANAADVILSKNNHLLEPINIGTRTYIVSVFENAPGDQIADHQYQYRPGAPITEYYYNCGKTLGKLHNLAKSYTSVHKRFDFFDKYNEQYFESLIPKKYADLNTKLNELLEKLRGLPKDTETYGIVHFDFSDGNYNIDYSTGKITVYDFDNCRYCWYLYDLANLWTHGVGWIQFEPDASKRRQFMNEYFRIVVEGYRSETYISDEMLSHLPLMIQTVLMENIIDEFETLNFAGEDMDCDEEQIYRIKCMLNDILFLGFFDTVYSCQNPFELESL